MRIRNLIILLTTISLVLLVQTETVRNAFGQADPEKGTDEKIVPDLPEVGEDEIEEPEVLGEEAEEEEREEETPAEREEEVPEVERVEAGEAGEGENIWGIRLTAAVVMNYVYANSPESYTITYRFEIKGEAKAATAVINGDATIEANVAGFLANWPTGECRLEVSVPSVPFELTFRRTDEEKGSLRLVFKRAINEDWQSKCTFTDAPGARFDTRGEPEKWLTKALEKARPPLKSIVAELGLEETTTTFVISKEIIADAPLGSGEIEGTGVITISRGGLE